MRFVQRTCAVCNKAFSARDRGSKTSQTCSRSCRQLKRWSKPAYVCPGCGKSFRSRYIRKFCSSECYNAQQVRRTQKVCVGCGKKYETTGRHIRPTYCSRECFRVRGRVAVEMRTCKGCGKQFQQPTCNKNRGFYCSRLCYHLHRLPIYWCEYAGVKFRSKWEQTYARWLDLKKLPWKYEPRRHVMSNGCGYTPDFLVEFPGGPRVVELHRLIHPHPNDVRKLDVLRLAQQEIPGFLLLDENDIATFRRELRQAARRQRIPVI